MKSINHDVCDANNTVINGAANLTSTRSNLKRNTKSTDTSNINIANNTNIANNNNDNVHMALNYWFHPPDSNKFTQPYKHEFWSLDWKQRKSNNNI